MVDANGELKPFDKFLNDVQSIEKRYNSNYLRAEYNFAVASAQSASQWEQIAADGDRFDLQYRTAGDSKVRPTHAALNGVTLPPSSPFWDSFMPPNGWNCRCTAVQVRRGKYPHIDVAEALALGEEATADDKRGILRFNPGKLGKTFPDYNPYTISRCRDCDVAKGKSTLAKDGQFDSEICAVCRWGHECESRYVDNKDDKRKGPKISASEKDDILALPKDKQFTMEYDGGKGCVFEHTLVCRATADYEWVMDAARAFADMDGDVFINPEIHKNSPQRSSYYEDMPPGVACNPDLKTSSFGYVDVKSPLSKPKMGRNAVHASRDQLSNVCFTDHNIGIDMDLIEKKNRQIFECKDYHHDYIFWYVGGKLLKYKRPQS